MPARRAASAMFSYEPFTTLIWLSTDRTPSTLEATLSARLRSAAVAADHHLALLGEDGLHFLAAKTAQHVFHFRLVVGAMIFDGVEAEHPHQLFREHAREQVVGLRTACFV